MARTQNDSKSLEPEMGLVSSILFESKKDEEILQLVNQYSSLRPAFKPKSLIREILLEVLPERIERIQESKRALKAG